MLPCSLYAQDLHDIFIPFLPSGLTTSCCSILRTGWTDGYFDGIFICEVLEHAIDVQMALQELNRILAIGGTLIIVDKNDSKLASWPGKLPEWEQWFNINKLNILLEEIGFSVEKIDQNVHYENGKNDNLFFGIVAIKIENCN